MTGLPTQRNDIAVIGQLVESGDLPVRLLRHVRVDHQDGCPQKITAKNLQCWCQPRISVLGQVVEVTSA